MSLGRRRAACALPRSGIPLVALPGLVHPGPLRCRTSLSPTPHLPRLPRRPCAGSPSGLELFVVRPTQVSRFGADRLHIYVYSAVLHHIIPCMRGFSPVLLMSGLCRRKPETLSSWSRLSVENGSQPCGRLQMPASQAGGLPAADGLEFLVLLFCAGGSQTCRATQGPCAARDSRNLTTKSYAACQESSQQVCLLEGAVACGAGSEGQAEHLWKPI